MTESAGVQVGKRPVSVHGGMTERLEIQQRRLLDFAQLLMIQNKGFGGSQKRRLHEPAKQF
jgi:hypothetical protein